VQEVERERSEVERERSAVEAKLHSLSSTLDIRDNQVEDLEKCVEEANGKVDMMAAQMATMHEYLYDKAAVAGGAAAAGGGAGEGVQVVAPDSGQGQQRYGRGERRKKELELESQLADALGAVAALEEQARRDRENSRTALIDFMRDCSAGGGLEGTQLHTLNQEMEELREAVKERDAVIEKFAARMGKHKGEWWRRLF